MDSTLTPRIRVFADLAHASEALARHVRVAAQAAVADHGRFRVVISGGSTPLPLFRRLAGPLGQKVPWARSEVYFADERCVPPSSPESNYGAARGVLLDRVPLRPRAVHPVATAGRSPARAAAELDRRLQSIGRSSPMFDLVLLGIGPDGHTASLFPGAASLREHRRRAVAVPVPGRPPMVPRVTMTLATLSNSAEVCFLVAGADKAQALDRIWHPRGGRTLPAARIRPRGQVTWFVDRSAVGHHLKRLRSR